MIRRPSFLRTFFSLGTGDIQTLSPGSGAIAGHLPGLTTGGTVTAGSIGEQTTSTIASGSAVGLTTATSANITNTTTSSGGIFLVLTSTNFVLAAATATLFQCGPSNTTATLPGQITTPTIYGGENLVVWGANYITTGTFTIQLRSQSLVIGSGTIQLFLVANATFSAGTVSAYGTISTIRVG